MSPCQPLCGCLTLPQTEPYPSDLAWGVEINRHQAATGFLAFLARATRLEMIAKQPGNLIQRLSVTIPMLNYEYLNREPCIGVGWPGDATEQVLNLSMRLHRRQHPRYHGSHPCSRWWPRLPALSGAQRRRPGPFPRRTAL